MLARVPSILLKRYLDTLLTGQKVDLSIFHRDGKIVLQKSSSVIEECVIDVDSLSGDTSSVVSIKLDSLYKLIPEDKDGVVELNIESDRDLSIATKGFTQVFNPTAVVPVKLETIYKDERLEDLEGLKSLARILSISKYFNPISKSLNTANTNVTVYNKQAYCMSTNTVYRTATEFESNIVLSSDNVNTVLNLVTKANVISAKIDKTSKVLVIDTILKKVVIPYTEPEAVLIQRLNDKFDKNLTAVGSYSLNQTYLNNLKDLTSTFKNGKISLIFAEDEIALYAQGWGTSIQVGGVTIPLLKMTISIPQLTLLYKVMSLFNVEKGDNVICLRAKNEALLISGLSY